MSIVSLLTDFGLSDNFVGVIKAVILRVNPQAKIVDICHQVKPQDILEAGFLLKSSFKFFPKGTIHLVVVDPGVGSKRKKLMVRTKNYYFIAPDNGILTFSLEDEPPQEIVEITNDKYFLKPTSDTFHGRDIFAPVAAYLSKGERLNKFGKRLKSFDKLELPKVKVNAKSLRGEIIYIDRFGNLISNIDKETLQNFTKNKRFRILIKGKTIDKLSYSYAEGFQSKPIALMDSFNFLEIAIKNNSAKDYLGAEKGAKFKIIKI